MKKYINTRLNEKGQVSLLMTLVVMLILLYSVLFVINMNIKEMKVIKNTEKSMRAFYIADSGIEKVLYKIKDEGGITFGAGETIFGPISVNGGSLTVVSDPLSNTIIKSTGSYGGVSRVIEINY